MGLASVVRPLALPPGIPVVAVGGSTLGGSGKTPLAIACTEVLASLGAKVVLVGHAYRARPGRPRVVTVRDDVAEVGDEALACALALARIAPRSHVAVVVAPRRSDAIAFAVRERRPDVVVLDGVLQTHPRRASLSLLAVDAVAPWGSGAVPPRGDLRAPIPSLRAACDLMVSVGDNGDANVQSHGVWRRGTLVPWDELRSARLGIFCALARPERLLGMLARRGVHPERIVRVRDHGPLNARAVKEMWEHVGTLDWIATPKCLTHLGDQKKITVDMIDMALELSSPLRARLAALTDGAGRHNLESR
jgi:tetraacyldisaccharide 4'-kinase